MSPIGGNHMPLAPEPRVPDERNLTIQTCCESSVYLGKVTSRVGPPEHTHDLFADETAADERAYIRLVAPPPFGSEADIPQLVDQFPLARSDWKALANSGIQSTPELALVAGQCRRNFGEIVKTTAAGDCAADKRRNHACHQ